MSYNKELYPKRLHHVNRVVANRLADWNMYYGHNPADPVRRGRMRKVHPFNCGRPRCGLCGNARHMWGHVTLAEVKADIGYKEQLAY